MNNEQERVAYQEWADLHPIAYAGIEYDAFIAGYQAGRAALLPLLTPEEQSLLHEMAACLEADGAYLAADDVDTAVEIIRRILQQQGGAALQEQAEFELVQDGMVMASADGKREAAWREIQHYAAVYGQDGPVEIYEVTRRRIEGEAK